MKTALLMLASSFLFAAPALAQRDAPGVEARVQVLVSRVLAFRRP